MDAEKGHVPGVLCFFGEWNKQKNDTMDPSQPVSVRRYVSTRGLEEPASGNSKTARSAGCAVQTPPQPENIRPDLYQFVEGRRQDLEAVTICAATTPGAILSPRLFHACWQHQDGKTLLGRQLSRTPPKGNGPRYPLCIASWTRRKPVEKGAR